MPSDEDDFFYIPAIEKFIGRKLDCIKPEEEWLTMPKPEDLGSGHANCLNMWKKSSKNSHFLVLNIPFWVQNCRFKDFFEI